ncbi:hypothetical protein BDR05DRAFT_957855 [Suillus weaverae]|nr:hypothetical protein BDR05DRAFT_957855 [Suillus weaverae]
MYRFINIQLILPHLISPHTSPSDSNPHTSSHKTSQYFQSDNDKRRPIYTHADLRKIGDGIVDDLFRASGLGQLSAHAFAVLERM